MENSTLALVGYERLPMQRVFISSVMKGFQPERDAARRAVESLGMKPIMAEDFGAKPLSPQLACLEAVRNSDIYVGVLGARHGFRADSGLSVTEEEFQEARRRGLSVLFFVQDVVREPEQQQFVQRIQGYEQGYFLDSFSSLEQLRTQMTTALHRLVAQPQVTTLDLRGAKARINALIPSGRGDHEVVVGAVLVPMRTDEYFPPLEMNKPNVKDDLQKHALFGNGAIFSTEVGIQINEGRDSLRFEQQNQHRQLLRCVEFRSDGSILGLCTLTHERNGFSLVRMNVIDQDAIQRWLTCFFRYANLFYSGLPSSAFLSSFYGTIFLKNVEHKLLGHLPQQEPSSMSLPMASFPDPLMIPSTPQRIARADLSDASTLSSKLVGLLEREFRATGSYYESP